MKNKILAVLMILGFAGCLAVTSATFAVSGSDSAIAQACKDKKAGDKVKVDGKEMKCPDAKKK